MVGESIESYVWLGLYGAVEGISKYVGTRLMFTPDANTIYIYTLSCQVRLCMHTYTYSYRYFFEAVIRISSTLLYCKLLIHCFK